VRRIILILILILVFSMAAYANGQQEVVPVRDNDGYLSVSAGDFDVRWKAEGDQLNFEITAPTTGWVSVGFDPERVMKGANFVIGYVDGDTVVAKDHYGSGTFAHKADEELGGTGDIISYDGREENGETTLQFTIPIDSGDEFDTVLTPGEVHTVLVACGPDGSDNFTKKHSKRSKVDVKL